MKTIFKILLGLLLSLPYLSIAQTATVFGTLKNNRKQTLPFVNVVIQNSTTGVTTDINGDYSLQVPANKNIILIYSFIGYNTEKIEINLTENESKKINLTLQEITIELPEYIINGEKNRESAITEIPVEESKKIPTVGGGVESIIKSQPGVSSNNELSSQYSVRGGNFDENLIYVNEIEIYRPLLASSGQQEGLSFVNPDLTKGILFSAGGFDAKYGDKMSSVLDITYKTPTNFKGSVTGSFLGGTAHIEGINKSKKLSYLVGTRFKSNKYILNSLPTKGEYNPTFYDFQTLLNYKINKKSDIEFLTNYSINKFKFIPKSSTSNFGTAGDLLQLRVFFEGEESDKFETTFGALKYTYKIDSSLTLKLIGSAYNSNENQAFDILGEYYLEEVSSSGTPTFNKGIGSFRTHARNDLNVTVFNLAHRGKKVRINNKTEWQIKYQKELINDRVEQWQLVDSAGYTIPQSNNNDITLLNVANASNVLNTNRYSGFIQQNWTLNNNYTLIVGVRTNYWDFTNEFLVAPRATIAKKANWEKDVLFRFSSGVYYQPPFYKEIKNIDGTINPNVKSQKSVHFVFGGDYNFIANERPFKFVAEIYYKSLTNLVPYQVDNVQVRYLPNQLANGYTTGIDMKINGEFVKGLESWASLSFLSSKEDIVNDSYLDANGILVEPGYIARPTDQRFNLSIFFQDYLPSNPSFKVHLNLVYGSGLPFGPASQKRYEDTFRMPAYRRVDIGFSKQLKTEKPNTHFLFKHFTSAWLSFEVFNLLQTNNTISYLWIKDFSNNSFAVPNYLTSRRLNLKLILEF